MSPGWRISPALLAAIAAAAVSFGVCFAVVADATRTTAPDRLAARPAGQAVQAKLALTPAPSLRVRSSLLPPPARPVTAASTPPTTQAPANAQTQTTQTTTTPPAPTPTPKPTPKPKPKAKPKPPPSGPDFDESGPQGPPSGG